MADMYDAITNATCSSSSSPPENDDFSHFLGQILLRATSSPSSPSLLSHKMQSFDPLSHFSPENQHRQLLPPPSLLPDPTRISAVDSSSGPCVPTNVGSAWMGVIDNDFDDYDCENEDGFEGLMEEAPAKPTPRNSSKRSRAAEVHNLSEKRRRSRINEKMKALQNLIPNSNKTDKASMLDEAIEYLKQLQLQVQMLTMRNGSSLHPMCLPGVLQPNQLSQMRIGFHEGNEPLKMTSTPPINPETMTNSVFSLPNQCNNLNRPSQLVTNLSNIINSKISFRLESSTQAQHRPFGLHTCSEKICREATHFQSPNADHSKTNLDLRSHVKATSSIPFDAQASGSKDKALDASNHGRS